MWGILAVVDGFVSIESARINGRWSDLVGADCGWLSGEVVVIPSDFGYMFRLGIALDNLRHRLARSFPVRPCRQGRASLLCRYCRQTRRGAARR